MSVRALPVKASLALAAAVSLLALGACSSSGDDDSGVARPTTAAAFDQHPCALFTSAEMTSVVTDPFQHLTNFDPQLKGKPNSTTGQGDPACTYVYEPKDGQKSAIPQAQEVQVSVSHAKTDAAMRACVEAAGAGAGIYQIIPIADKACITPQYDVWLLKGKQIYHVSGNPQPGWQNVADGHDTVAPLVLAIARAAADRVPQN